MNFPKLKVKNNKKLAERKVEKIRHEYEKTLNEKPTISNLDINNKANIKFCDFMINWLDIINPRVVKTTFAGYERIVKGKVYNYFKKLDISLKDLKPYHIQDFYTELYNLGLKENTILRFFLALYYGLRRSEALGIKWDAVDFGNKKIIIRHTISQTKVDGELQIVAEDKTKNQSSYRTLPLIPEIRFHDLRHSCASLLLANKVSMKDIQI